MNYEVPIERGKIREFARATLSRHPAYQETNAVIPPTMLTTARLIWEPRDQDPMRSLGFDMRRVLHGEEEYVFHGPLPRAGQVLEVTTWLEDQWEKQGGRGGTMRFARVVNEFRDAESRLVAEQRTTVIETGKVPETQSANKENDQ